MMAGAFVVGCYFTLSQVLIPMIRALTETTTEMPVDVAFNRGVADTLAGYEDGGGATYVLASEVTLDKTADWWQTAFTKKKQLTLRNLSTAPLASESATTQQITVNTKELYDAGSLQANCQDLRVVFVATQSANMRTELPRSFYPASGATNCSDSTATTVAFPLQEALWANGGSDSNYELYYGNASVGQGEYPRTKAVTGAASLTVPDDDSLSSTSMTMTYWVRWTASFGWQVIGKYNPSNPDALNEYLFQSNGDGRWYIRINNTSVSYAQNSGQLLDVTYDKWHHIAITYNATNSNLKIVQNFDRVLLNVTRSFSMTPTADNLRVDSWGSNTSVDDIRLWNVALTDAQIQERAGVNLNESDPLFEHLTGYWKLDEGSGTAVTDRSSFGNNGTLSSSAWTSGLIDTGYSVGSGLSKAATLVCPFNGTTTCVGGETPTTATGAIRYSGGSAVSFDGYDDMVSGTGVDVQDFTFQTWLKPNFLSASPSYAQIFNVPNRTVVYIYNSNVYVYIMTSSGWQTYSYSTGNTVGVWQHLAVSFNNDARTVRFYKDGVYKGQSTIGTLPISTVATTSWIIGKQGTQSYAYNGTLDEIILHDRVLTDEEISSTYTNINSTLDAHTKLLLHFDENGDDPRNTGKAIDSSGNGNHGTITGAKYVGGLVGVDASTSDTGQLPMQSTAGHQGVFIEEGTTNLITNPSFEHSTYNTNWGTNYFNYATASATFTPSMAKRNSAGPFAAGFMSQGSLSGTNADSIQLPAPNQPSEIISGYFAKNMDQNQGSIVFWITPEWNGNDGINHVIFSETAYGSVGLNKAANNNLTFSINYSSVSVSASNWVAGTTYAVVCRWDTKNSLDGTNYMSISVDDVHTFGKSSSFGPGGWQNMYLGGATNAIIEGFTIYRRPLYDGQFGVDAGNGDEIAKIYDSDLNNGNGISSQDPTLVTGSWDVTFALPTNTSAGALATGTGNAWSHPHASNLLYTSTTNTGGYMMNGTASNDGWSEIPWYKVGGASGVVAAYQPIGAANLSDSYINKANPGTYNASLGVAPTLDTATGWSFDGTQWLDTGYAPSHPASMIARFSDVGNGADVLIGSSTATQWQWFSLVPAYISERYYTYGPTWAPTIYSILNAGVMAVTADRGYLNGAPDGLAIDGTTLGTQRTIYIGSLNETQTGSSRKISGKIQALAIYNSTLGGDQVANVTDAMEALDSDGSYLTTSALATNEKIFSGGYKYTSSGANQGISRSFVATDGGDYVLRAVGHSDGICNPQVKITRADGTTEISHLNGSTSSTRTDPDVYVFTWESPATEANHVQLINTASSGTCFWHQVEVYNNLITNPSMETFQGSTPDVPVGFSTGDLDAGDTEQELAIVHSGLSSIKFMPSASSGESVAPTFSQTANNFYSTGVTGYGFGGSELRFWFTNNTNLHLQYQTSLSGQGQILIPTSTNTWQSAMGVFRAATSNVNLNRPLISSTTSSGGTRFVDDMYSKLKTKCQI